MSLWSPLYRWGPEAERSSCLVPPVRWVQYPTLPILIFTADAIFMEHRVKDGFWRTSWQFLPCPSSGLFWMHWDPARTFKSSCRPCTLATFCPVACWFSATAPCPSHCKSLAKVFCQYDMMQHMVGCCWMTSLDCSTLRGVGLEAAVGGRGAAAGFHRAESYSEVACILYLCSGPGHYGDSSPLWGSLPLVLDTLGSLKKQLYKWKCIARDEASITASTVPMCRAKV